MDLRGQEIKNTYGNVVTVGSSAGAPTTGELTNGQNSSFTVSFVSGDFGVGITPNNYANLNTLTIGSAAASAGGIIDFTGTSGRLASIYTEASGKIVLAADPTNGEAGTALEFNVDGSNAMFINSSQQVGIGTVSPSAKLEVVQTAASEALRVDGASAGFALVVNGGTSYKSAIRNASIGSGYFSTAAPTDGLIVQGNVGIGTSSPSVALHTNGFIRSANAGDTVYTEVQNDGLYAAGTDLYLVAPATKFLSLYSGGAEAMRITSTGNVGIGTSSPSQKLHVYESSASSQSYLVVENNRTRNAAVLTKTTTGGFYTGTSIGTDVLCWQVYDEANGERMRIDSSGNVGIGTSSPAQKLDVVGKARITDDIQLASVGPRIDFDNGNSSGYLRFWATSAGSERMRITSAGDVGIGTSTPETKLDVDGDIQTAAPETSTNAAWKLGNVGLGGVFVGAADYVTVSVGGLVVKLPIAIFPETQDYYDRVIADGGTFEGLLGYESAVTILKAE